jgi:caspase domain-containing protein
MIEKCRFRLSLPRGVRSLLAALGAFVLLAAFGHPAAADPSRVALVIGIGKYQNVAALPNPPHDAEAVAASLRNLGFDVEEKIDSGYTDLKESIRLFGQRAAKADAAVVFYAGHGIQVDHENYLIPADADLQRERDLLYETIKLDIVMGEVARAGKVGLVILDACRDNPFIQRVASTLMPRGLSAKGLAKVDNVPPNTAVAMATRGDTIAEDGSGDHSPYTAAILAHLEVPGLELGLFFRSVRDTVLKATHGRQEPYFASSIGADPFYFYPPRPSAVVKEDAVRDATRGNPDFDGVLADIKKLLDDRLPKASQRVIDIKQEPPSPGSAPPSASRPAPPAAAVAVIPPPPAQAAKEKPYVNRANDADRRKAPRDFLCTSIIERSQVGEQLTDADRVYLQKCK